MAIRSSQLVADVLRDTPAAVRVFLDYRMRCVGCPIAGFHTVADACREHGTDPGRFLASLRVVTSARAVGLAGPARRRRIVP